MKVAILGAGGIGLGTAALMASKGLSVRVWAPSATGIRPMLDGQALVACGALDGSFAVTADLDIASVVSGADLVIVAVPGSGLKGTLDCLEPLLVHDQPVAISAHLSLAALYLAKSLSRRGVSLPISAWASTAVTGRRTAPGEVEVGSLRKQMMVATIGPSDQNRMDGLLTKRLGISIKPSSSLLAVTLNNVNPTSHVAVALCNLTRMEYGEAWGSYRGISGAVAKLIESLDRERFALAAHFGMNAHSLPEHWHSSFGLPLGSIASMAAERNEKRGGGPPGPTSLDHRYVTEDVPFGIVPNIELGEIAGVDMTSHRACLHLLDTLYARNFTAENDLLPELGIRGMAASDLERLCRVGH